jgi:hypothetical protein
MNQRGFERFQSTSGLQTKARPFKIDEKEGGGRLLDAAVAQFMREDKFRQE